MLKTLLESLDKEVYTAEMVESIQIQFNEAVDTKAKEIADEAINIKTIELEEKSEAFISEMIETKTVELEEKAEEFMEVKLAEINESVESYLDKVVEDFAVEMKEKLDESLKLEKADMIIEAFESMVMAGGIDVMKIVEAKDGSYSDSKLAESVIKYDELMDEFVSMKKENANLLKTGIISEMKEGLSLVESKKFEKLSEMVTFSKDADFIEKLEVIKESVKGSKDNAVVITESVPSAKTNSNTNSYSHLV